MDVIEFNEYYETWYGGDVRKLRADLDDIHRAFPGKPIVISEYGYCACTTDRPEGDGRRVEILREHDKAFRERPYIAGLIFFCYNDYRTHQGDKGRGVLRQRVHGVVDVYGARKPSFEVLRTEASPVERVDVTTGPPALGVTVTPRKDVPAYPLDGYRVRAVAYDAHAIPLEKHEVALPRLEPGQQSTVALHFEERPARVQIDVVRPTGFSALTAEWTA
jgi:beta-glucuronidase